MQMRSGFPRFPPLLRTLLLSLSLYARWRITPRCAVLRAVHAGQLVRGFHTMPCHQRTAEQNEHAQFGAGYVLQHQIRIQLKGTI